MFIIRAHPDEDRPGKESQESVRQWADHRQVAHIPNILFIPAEQRLSSYALIQQAKFVMIYNSTIGLEASLMGAAVLCAGRSRFTQLPIVFFPATLEEYSHKLEEFLSIGKIFVPPHFQRNARRFLYYQLYRSSLPFGDYLEEDGIWPGFVKLRQFKVHQLSPASSPTMKSILPGILENGEFLLDADL
jgi:Capsule polysaccharide biosynthesis protein